MDIATFDDVLWTGDLNWDMDRQTGFSDTMRRFVDRLGLTSVWERHPVSYTHIHTDLKSTSTLDHFVVNERLLSVIVDSGVLHLGDNLSRHSPIMLKLNLGTLPVCPRTKPASSISRPAWYKASQEDKDLYTQELERRLLAFATPDSLTCSDPCCSETGHSQERDSFVLDLMSTVIETSHDTIPMSKGKTGHDDPSRNCPIWKSIPGWTEHVYPYKEDAAFWHSVWQSAGRPNKGVLRDIMCRTRNQYHYAKRRVKKMSNSIRAQHLLEASEQGSVKLLTEMKKIKGSKKDSDGLPESVGGVSGEDSIVEEFKKVYCQLYNFSGTQEAMDVLKQELSAEIGRSSIAEANKITGSVVKEASCRIKPSKGDVSTSYSSDALLNVECSDHLAPVFRSWIVHGTVTLSLLACAFLPLFKGGLKDPAKTDSYHAIAGSSVLLLWGDFLSSDSLQFGFKSGTSTTQCSWMVQEVASHFLRRGTPCIVTLLDCSKAFDMCQYSVLF